MSGDWRRLHRVRGVSWFTRKPLGSFVDPQSQDENPKTEVQQHQTGLTGGYRSDR
jgi:hypothetical protein